MRRRGIGTILAAHISTMIMMLQVYEIFGNIATRMTPLNFKLEIVIRSTANLSRPIRTGTVVAASYLIDRRGFTSP